MWISEKIFMTGEEGNMWMKQPILFLLFITMVPTIQGQNGEFDRWPGDVRVLLAHPLTLAWTHSLPDAAIEWCYYQFRCPETSPDEFLGWDNNEKKRLNISDNQLGWRFINEQYPCLGGIERDHAESGHAGDYMFYVITARGEEHVDNRAHITVVEGTGLRYSLTVGEKEHKFDLSDFDSELDPIEVTEDDTLPLKLKLLEGFTPSNLSILKQDKGWEAASVTCSQKQECQAGFSANKDTVKITASIETSVQGISQISINQPISYTMKEQNIVGLVVAVVFLVVFLLLLIILLICLCNKRARYLKKIRKYLLRKHDDSALKVQLRHLIESLNKASTDVENLTAEKNSLQMSNNSLRDNNTELEEKVEKLERDKENLLENLQKKTSQCKDFAQKNSHLQDQLTEKERELTRTKQETQADKDKMRKQHEVEVNNLQARITELERQSKKPGVAVRQGSLGIGVGEAKPEEREVGIEAEKYQQTSAPEFTDTSDLTDKYLGKFSPLELYVTVSGFPPPTVTWYRDTIQLKQRPGIIVISQTGNRATLTVNSNVSGKYYCVASNDYGDVQSQVIIVQIGTPSRPMFSDSIRDMKVKEGSRAFFQAKVHGYPPPDFMWFKDGVQLLNTDRIKLETGKYSGQYWTTLTIEQFSAEDAGRITLVATNDEGKVQCSAHLRVYSDRTSNPAYRYSSY